MNVYEVLLGIILQFMIILFMIRTIRDISIKLSGSAGKQIVDMARKAGGAAIGIGTGVALGATAFAGRQAVGRTVGSLADSSTLKGMAASDKAYKRFLGNTLLKTGQGARKTSFDIRNTDAGKQLGAGLGKLTGAKINLDTKLMSAKVDGKAKSIDAIVDSKTKKKEQEMRARIDRMKMSDADAKKYWEKRGEGWDKKKSKFDEQQRLEGVRKYGDEISRITSRTGKNMTDAELDAFIKRKSLEEKSAKEEKEKGRILTPEELKKIEDDFENKYKEKIGSRPPQYTNGKDANKAIRDEYLKRREDTDNWKKFGNIIRGKVEGGSPGNESAERTAEHTAAGNVRKSLGKEGNKKNTEDLAKERLKDTNEILEKILENNKKLLDAEKVRIKNEKDREMTQREQHRLAIDAETAKREAEHIEIVNQLKEMTNRGAEQNEIFEKLVEKKRKEREIDDLKKLLENKEKDEKTLGAGDDKK